jgi:hypothetical protein
MPSLYRWDSRSDPYDASMRNLAKARARWRPPRPWRSPEESEMIRRYVAFWLTCRSDKPSARSWARQLGISHVWLLKLVRRFRADPQRLFREMARGDPRQAELERAKQRTDEMRMRGELRPRRLRNCPGHEG